jgi:hypothetical protein
MPWAVPRLDGWVAENRSIGIVFTLPPDVSAVALPLKADIQLRRSIGR